MGASRLAGTADLWLRPWSAVHSGILPRGPGRREEGGKGAGVSLRWRTGTFPHRGVRGTPSLPLFGFSSGCYTKAVPPQRTLRRSRRPIRFPNRIHHYRLKAGLTQHSLAKAVGRLRWAVSAWERGANLPNVPDLFRLAKALNTFVEALYPCLYEAARRPAGGNAAA